MDAKQYIQRCYNAVGLPDQLDVHRRYSYLFNDWSAKLVESVKPQVHIMVNRRFMAKRMVSHIWTDELKDITLGEEVTRVNLARDAVPWVILAAHILLDYTADALEIATSLVDTFHIHGISQSTIEQVVAWSLYPMGLDYNVDLGNSKTRQEQLKYAAANESRLSEKRTEIWREIFDHLHEHKAFAHPKVGAGVVYFALYRLPQDHFIEDDSHRLYTVLFIDAATGALAFTSPFQREQQSLGAISRYMRNHIDLFVRKHNQPAFMICVNSWDRGQQHASLVILLQDVVQGLPPLNTRFCIYTTEGEDIFCDLPATLAGTFLEITERLETALQKLKVDQNLSFYTERGPAACWEYILASSFGDLLERKFHMTWPRSYYPGRANMKNTPCKLSFAIPGKGTSISLTDQRSWDRLNISPYLDMIAGNTTAQHEVVDHLEEDVQEELHRTLNLSASYFLHHVSSETKSRHPLSRWLELLLYMHRVANSSKTSFESSLVKITPVETKPAGRVDRQPALKDDPNTKTGDSTTGSMQLLSNARTPAGTPVYSADAAVAMVRNMQSKYRIRSRGGSVTSKVRGPLGKAKIIDGNKSRGFSQVSHQQK
ncbi:hypothetical protein LXG23DRAFT_26913 [Yarrowia lipolytica]|uniref:Uncharacterized protein n=1 Tax=Yarrowia lipolytica TaxID=4952 RepID=A0A1D8N4I7_YARLL|nr:hypothetical protein YALI1_A11854g [Yarrowia lipolytica]KAB8282996.1 hypothetical protein BKA91DRAFT_18720 [Yarrowia lipolytica]KAE8169915.1 hypothetical protein BKA90DRAFT_43083 [Yarrowia lipolytica]KAJ8051591.1 hypothetical protein LXG23DRAFT_26913 [Yarrowia lipolytica]